MYKFFNANKNGNFVDDCVVRAISLAENKTWLETFIELSYMASKKGTLIDDADFVEEYLDNHYLRKCVIEDVTIKEFAQKNKNGIFIVSSKGHITCVLNGTIYDTFDCSNYKMKCCWKVY